MTLRLLTPLLPLAAAGSRRDRLPAGRGRRRRPTQRRTLAEDASLAWSVQLEPDWSPTHAVAVGDTVVVSTSWEIDEGTEITAYRADGSIAWQESGYGGALLAPIDDDRVLICDFEESWTVSVDDGSVIAEGNADDERCPVADDDAGIAVPRNDEAYAVHGDVLSVDGPDGTYDITLDAAPSRDLGRQRRRPHLRRRNRHDRAVRLTLARKVTCR